MKTHMKTKRVILIIIICFVVVVAGFTVVYRDAVFQRGTPLPYISKMVTLNDKNLYAKVFSDKDVYILRTDTLSRQISENGLDMLEKHIEETYGVKFTGQMGSNLSFDSNEKTIVADLEVYWRYYLVVDLTVYEGDARKDLWSALVPSTTQNSTQIPH